MYIESSLLQTLFLLSTLLLNINSTTINTAAKGTTNKITNKVIISVSHIQVIPMFHGMAHIALLNLQHRWLATIHLLSDLATWIFQLDNITKTCTKYY